jgi:hypothetical protein
MTIFIHNILTRPVKSYTPKDFILDIPEIEEYYRKALLATQLSMKMGTIWQESISCYDGFENLKIGHPSGLDILHHERKLAIELKNSTMTDNKSSRTANFDKLAKFKKEHPEYVCIYGCINNSKNAKDLLQGQSKIIIHDGVEILYLVGNSLFDYLLGKNKDEIIDFVKKTVREYFIIKIANDTSSSCT